jgi:hypothetical protein
MQIAARRQEIINKKENMKNIVIALVCALVASPAFGQPKSNQEDKEGTEVGVTVTGAFVIIKSVEGVTAVRQPSNDTLVVRTAGTPLTGYYVLEGPGHLFDKSGREVSHKAIHPGQSMRVVYTKDASGKVTVDRVIVEG